MLASFSQEPKINDSFYFQIHVNSMPLPANLPELLFKFQIFKGLQKCDESKLPVRARQADGRLLFNGLALNFFLPIYTKTRNIEFTLRVTSLSHEEVQSELTIKSGDYVAEYLKSARTVFSEESVPGSDVAFHLFVERSQSGLSRVVQEFKGKHQESQKKEQRSLNLEINSQSDISDASDGEIGGLKKKIARKRGHDGKLKSKNDPSQNQLNYPAQISTLSDRKNSDSDPFGERQQGKSPLSAGKMGPIFGKEREQRFNQTESRTFIANELPNSRNNPPKLTSSYSQDAEPEFRTGKFIDFSKPGEQPPTRQQPAGQATIRPGVPKQESQMKYSRPEVASKQYSEDLSVDPTAAAEWQKYKTIIFYILFTIVSAALFMNAIRPSRKV